MELGLAAGEAHVTEQQIGEPQNVHAVEICETDVCKRRGDAACLIKFRCRGISGRLPAHGCAGVDEQVNLQVLLLLVELHEKTIESSVDVPVDRAKIIADAVVAVVRELKAGARLAAFALGTVSTAEELFGKEIKLFELRQECGVEDQRCGGLQSARRMRAKDAAGNRGLLRLRSFRCRLFHRRRLVAGRKQRDFCSTGHLSPRECPFLDETYASVVNLKHDGG